MPSATTDLIEDRRLLAIVPSTLGGASHLYQWKPEGILSAHGELPGASCRYTYDGSDRLTDETRKSWLSDATNWLNLGLPSSLTGLITLATVGSQPTSASYTYSLDGADNLVEVKTPSVVWDGVPNSNNQYVSAKGNTWQYDAAGNLQDDGTHRYTWDAQYRLLSITNKATQASSTFAYDGRSRLVQKTESATPASTPVVTRYLWCEETICQSQDGQNNVVASYYAEGEVQSGSARYYIKDHLGSVTDVVSVAGANLGKLDYGPYGEPEKASGNLTDFRYAGMLYHPATGFYFAHYRVYDPSTGRWLSRDPIGEAGGVNLYGYVGGEPSIFVDPTGKSLVSEGVWAVATYGPSVAWQAYKDSNTAVQAAKDMAGGTPEGMEGLNGGAADAYRHCVWSCLMTRSIGRSAAVAIGAKHESEGDNSQMDGRNNEMGCFIGEYESGPCEEACMTHLPELLSNRDWSGRNLGPLRPLGARSN